jgi:hypothetical protein
MIRKIFNSIDAWYFPNIDYWKMLDNFRWTKDLIHHAIIFKGEPIYPLDHVFLMYHSKAFHYNEEKKREELSFQQKFQFWNKQFNDELSKILKKIKPKLILEVGAGDGMLSRILFDRKFPIIATDNYDWPFNTRYFNVRELDYKEALKKYKPDVVISSWMPLYTDWTPDFRKAESVKHYITIGEVKAACGGSWSQRKDWKMTFEKEATKYALCRTDDLFWHKNKLNNNFMMNHSSVYKFSRKE